MGKIDVSAVRTMMKMRSLGFTQKEIGDELGVSQATIKYHFGLLRKRATKDGIDRIFTDYFQLVVISPTGVRFSYGHFEDGVTVDYHLDMKDKKDKEDKEEGDE